MDIGRLIAVEYNFLLLEYKVFCLLTKIFINLIG